MGLLMKSEIEKSESRYRTSNEYRLYRFGAFRFGQVDAGGRTAQDGSQAGLLHFLHHASPRRTEQNRKEYFFRLREEFAAMIAADDFWNTPTSSETVTGRLALSARGRTAWK